MLCRELPRTLVDRASNAFNCLGFLLEGFGNTSTRFQHTSVAEELHLGLRIIRLKENLVQIDLLYCLLRHAEVHLLGLSIRCLSR